MYTDVRWTDVSEKRYFNFTEVIPILQFCHIHKNTGAHKAVVIFVCQPDASLCCKSTDVGLVHHMV